MTFYLNHLLSVFGWIHRWLSQQHTCVACVKVHLGFAECVVIQMAHVIPISHNAILHGVVHLQHGSQFASFFTNHQILKIEVEKYKNINVMNAMVST